jgi:DNA (cytosine-5)-methyltransferase 1
VPVAAINEDCDPAAREDDLWPNGSPIVRLYLEVRPKPEADCVKRASDRQLRLGISTSIRSHDRASYLGHISPSADFDAAALAKLRISMPTAVQEDRLPIEAEELEISTDEDRDFLRTRDVPNYSHGTDPVVLIDLFSGCGGLTYGALEGLRRIGRGGQLALAVDHDPVPLQVLSKTLGEPLSRFREVDLGEVLAPVGSDLTAGEGRVFREMVQTPREAVLLAGPPCQGHSPLNNYSRHDDPRNDLYLGVARAAELVEPKAVIVENVGSVASDRRRAVAKCGRALQALGYSVATKRLELRSLGVPQTRVRHLLVATRGSAFDWDALPSLAARDLRWALEDLLDAEGSGPFDAPSLPSPDNRARIDWLFDEGEHDLPNHRRPVCHQSDHSYLSMYGRLRWDRPAQTVTTGFGSIGQGRFVHPLRRRTLTPHEAARLQCLPDYVDFSGVSTRGRLATMIGNLAPPLLASRIVETLAHQDLL